MKRKDLKFMLGLDINLTRRRGVRQSRKGRNGRKGWKKLDLAKTSEYLVANSKPMSAMYIGRGKRKPGAEAQVRQKRALTDTKRQLLISSGLKISTSTWYRTLRTVYPECTTCKRVLDKCGKCQQWDEQVDPACFSIFCVDTHVLCHSPSFL